MENKLLFEELKNFVNQLPCAQDPYGQKAEALEIKSNYGTYGKDQNYGRLYNDLIELAKTGTPLEKIRIFTEDCALNCNEDIHSGQKAFEDLCQVPGHPLQVLEAENKELEAMIEKALSSHEEKEALKDTIWQVSVHDMKKGDLLYPTLKVRHGFPAGHDYLWDSDIELRTHYLGMMRQSRQDELWDKHMDEALHSIQDMLWIENSLLYPLCALAFSEADWQEIYQNAKDYPACLNVEPVVWDKGEEFQKAPLPDPGQKVVLGGGTLTAAQLNVMLNSLPIELTFVDVNNQNAYFNEGHKAFKRPTIALGHEVFECHPAKVGAMVKGMLEDFKSGKKDSVHIWMNKQDKPYYVTYMALRDTDGTYMGTLEIVQPMEFAKEHFAASNEVKKQIKGW